MQHPLQSLQEMSRSRYTPEQKQEAIDLATTVGTAEASRRTGINSGTIGSWLTRAGLANADPEGRAERIRAAHETWVERRADLGNRMGEVAADALEQISGFVNDPRRTREARELATTLAVLVDKAQLLSGAATARTETTATEPAASHDTAIEDARNRARNLRAV
jgi:transposase-like protein